MRVFDLAEETLRQPEPGTELEMTQRMRQLKSAEEELKKAREELASREQDITRKAEELRKFAEETVKRDERLQEREKTADRREDELIRNAHPAAAAALESKNQAIEEREKKLASDARNLKNFAAQLQKRDQEMNIRIKSFNDEAEQELRGKVEALARRDQEAQKRDTDAAARAQEAARREEELEKREKDASAKFQEAARKEDQVRFRENELSRREKDIQKLELDAVRRQEETSEAAAVSAPAGRDDAKLNEQLMSRQHELALWEERLGQQTAELTQRQDEIRNRENSLKAVSEDTNRREEELIRREEALALREQALAAEPARPPADYQVKAGLDELATELEAKREELRVRNKELKLKQEELERGEVVFKETSERLRAHEDRLLQMEQRLKEAAVAPPGLSDEDKLRLDLDLGRRSEELRLKDEELQGAARRAMEQLDERERDLTTREEALMDEAGRLTSMAAGLKARSDELQSREDNIQLSLQGLSDKEQVIKELDEKRRMLEEEKRASEQFSQELRALDAVIQKTFSEQEAADLALRGREEVLDHDEDALDLEKDELLRAKKDHDRGSDMLRVRALELENGAKSLAEREGVLKAEEQRIDQHLEEIRKRKDDVETSEKDLHYKEVHLATLEEEIKDCPYCSAKDGFVSTMRAIAEARALGADTSDAERLFKQARAALDSSSYEGAVQYARKAMILAREAKQKYLVYGVSYILSGAERAVKSAAQLGVDTTEADGFLRSAKESLEKKDYELAESMAKKAERAAILAEDKVRELSDRLERISRKLEEIRSYGVDLSEAESAVQASLLLVKDRKQAEARSRLEGVEETAFLAFRREATRLLDEARELMTVNRVEGVELSDAELFFAKAEERLAEGDYGKCIQCAREAKRLTGEAKAAQPSAPVEGAQPGTARRVRSRPRILAGTVRLPQPGGPVTPPVIVQPSAQSIGGPAGDAMASGPAGPATSGTALDVMPGGSAVQTPVQSPVLSAMQQLGPTRMAAPSETAAPPREYECPNCQNRFIVEETKRPLMTKCPRCLTLMKLN